MYQVVLVFKFLVVCTSFCCFGCGFGDDTIWEWCFGLGFFCACFQGFLFLMFVVLLSLGSCLFYWDPDFWVGVQQCFVF